MACHGRDSGPHMWSAFLPPPGGHMPLLCLSRAAPVCWFARAAPAKCHRVSGFNSRSLFSLSCGSGKSRDQSPFEGSEGHLSRASLPAAAGLRVGFGTPGLVEVSPPRLASLSHDFLPVCLAVSKAPLLIRAPVVLD